MIMDAYITAYITAYISVKRYMLYNHISIVKVIISCKEVANWL